MGASPGIDAEGETPCPDCQRLLESSGPDGTATSFCKFCGAKLHVAPISLREIAGGILDGFTSFQRPVLRTLRDLLIRPGRVAIGWIEGQRQSYVHPVKFLVVVGLIVALTFEPMIDLKARLNPDQGPVYEIGLAHHATQYFAFFCLALFLPLALSLRAVNGWFGVSRSWLEWYVLCAYCYAIAAALQLAINALSLFVSLDRSATAIGAIKGFLPLIWLVWGAHGFAPHSRRWHAVAATLLTQLLLVFLVAVSQAIIGQ